MKQKKISNDEIITFRCPKSLSMHLRKIVMSTIRQTAKMYTLSDMIRDTLNETYPPPKESELFDE